jgi:hypothetical protein
MMTELETKCVGSRTLAERLSEGPIPADEGLRYAALLGDALRDLHDSGKSHGAVSPETILITADGLELAPPAETAEPSDIPADIFAFGTVLGEMLGGPRQLAGDAPADGFGTEDHGIGQLIANCMARDPADRLPSMRKVLLELKLASLAARHSGMWATRCDSEAAIRDEMHRSEVRQEARLKEYETSLAGKEQAAGNALNSMRVDMDAVQGNLTDLQRKAEVNTSRIGELESGVQSAIQQLGTKLAEAIQKIDQEIGAERAVLESVRRSMAQTDDLIGRMVEAIEGKLAEVHRSAEENSAHLEVVDQRIKTVAEQNAKLAADVNQAQADMKARATVVESVRRSLSQTDDLVGRLVEAVESILDTLVKN